MRYRIATVGTARRFHCTSAARFLAPRSLTLALLCLFRRLREARRALLIRLIVDNAIYAAPSAILNDGFQNETDFRFMALSKSFIDDTSS